MTIYIAGPMSGLPDHNYSAFHAAAAELTAAGEDVINPAESGLQDEPWDYCIRVGLRQLLTCDTIYLLPGWEKSRGAQLEHYVAYCLDYKIRYAPRDTPAQPQHDPEEATH